MSSLLVLLWICWLIYFSAGEPQVMDYMTQQYKIFPAIADTYAIFFTKKFIMERLNQVYETEMSNDNFKSLPEVGTYKIMVNMMSIHLSL